MILWIDKVAIEIKLQTQQVIVVECKHQYSLISGIEPRQNTKNKNICKTRKIISIHSLGHNYIGVVRRKSPPSCEYALESYPPVRCQLSSQFMTLCKVQGDEEWRRSLPSSAENYQAHILRMLKMKTAYTYNFSLH